MHKNRYAIAFLIIVMIISLNLVSSSADAADLSSENEAVGDLARVEALLNGKPSTGGLLIRLSQVERDLYGMELPGSLSERLQALKLFVEDGSGAQPSMLFKIGVAEWVTLKRINGALPFSDRVGNLETLLEGEKKEGALSPRLEGIITKILPDGVTATPVQIQEATVFKAVFTTPLTVRSVAVGDSVSLEVEEDAIIGGTLAVPKGSRLFAEVTKVTLPRSYGRPSEIQFAYKNIETIGGQQIPVFVGEEAQKAMDVDSGVIGAAGASLAGILAFGPLGLLGGFLVRGNDKQIPAGTGIYVQTTDIANIDGYIAPNISNSLEKGSNDTQSEQDHSRSPSYSPSQTELQTSNGESEQVVVY